MKKGSQELAEEAAGLAGRDTPVAQDVRERNKGRHGRIIDRLELGDRAAVGGVELLGVAEADVVDRRGVAGQAVVGGRVVVLHLVVHRPDLGELAHHLREPGQVLGDEQARLGRGDRLELAADAVGGVGLHVERIEVRRPAELVEEDDVLGLGTKSRSQFRRAEQGGQVQAREPADPAFSRLRRESRLVIWKSGQPSAMRRSFPFRVNAAAGIPCY